MLRVTTQREGSVDEHASISSVIYSRRHIYVYIYIWHPCKNAKKKCSCSDLPATLSFNSVKPRNYFARAYLFSERIRNKTEDDTKSLSEEKVLKSESEAKWNRWKKRDGEEKRRKEVMGSGAAPNFYWRLRLALARKDKREIIIRPAEAWQPLLGTAERQTEHYAKDCQ